MDGASGTTYSCPECESTLTRDDDGNYVCEECGYYTQHCHNISAVTTTTPTVLPTPVVDNNITITGGLTVKLGQDIDLPTSSIDQEEIGFTGHNSRNTDSLDETCPHCHQASFTMDSCNKVCTSCGFVLEGVLLTGQAGDPGSNYIGNQCTFSQHNTMNSAFMKVRNSNSKTQCEGLRLAHQMMDQFKTRCFNDASVSEEAVSIVNRYHKERIRLALGPKYYSGACAMYIACRIRSKSIYVSNVCQSLSLSHRQFQKTLTDILNRLNIKLPPVDKPESARSVIEHFQFADGSDTRLMISRVNDLAELLDSRAKCCNIPTGSYDWYVGVVFTTWKSLDFTKRRRTLLSSYLKTHKCAVSKQLQPKIAQKCIGYIAGFLTEIVKTNASLFPLSVVGESCLSSDWGIAFLSDICLYRNIIISTLPETEIVRKLRNVPTPVDEDVVTISHPFINSEQIGEYDIPDSELHQYIHSDGEVKLRKLMRSQAV